MLVWTKIVHGNGKVTLVILKFYIFLKDNGGRQNCVKMCEVSQCVKVHVVVVCFSRFALCLPVAKVTLHFCIVVYVLIIPV